MAGSSKAPFLLPANFVDNPTEAPFPRRLIVYDESSDTWNATDDKDIIVKTKYLFVSYRNSDFLADADRVKLELNVQTVCHALQLPAYWLDYACAGSTQEEKNVDLYRIADVVRNAAKTLIVIKGGDESPHSPGWHSWGDRLWTLPEALLSGYGGDRLLYKAGTKPHKSVTLRDVANHAYKDGDKEMSLMNNYSGEPVTQFDIFLESLIKAIWKRTSGPVKGKEKAGALTAYEAERVYALMGFMPKRIIPDPNESEEEAFGRLMKENRLNKDLKTILNSSEKDIPVNVPTMSSMDPEHRRVLDKIPYTEGMRYDSGKCCLADTRVDILEDIKNCIDNKDGAYNEKRIFLLTDVAGSGKSTIAHSIASHYYKEGQLGSSFFFSVSNREKSQPKNLFRTIAKDIAEKYLAVREKLYAVLKDNSSLCTTESIQDQYDIFIQDPTKGDVLKDTVVVVIDALDECEQSGDARTTLLRIIAKEMSAISSNLRVFLTARAGDAEVLRILNSAQCTQIFTMDKDSHSRSSDIQTFFLHKFSSYSEKFPGDWLDDLIRMSGNLFIWASTVCSYILNENDVRSPAEKLKIILSFKKDSKEEADLDSPDKYLYKLYTEVLKNAFNIPNLNKESLKTTVERYTTVMGVVLVTYTSLSSSDIDELLGSRFDSKRVMSRMGSLLDGTTHPESPVQLLHASFGDFLRNKSLSGDFHIEVQIHHGELAKNCLEVMNRSLKFNFFNLKDASVVENDLDQYNACEKMRRQIHKALQYSSQYWLAHITQMSKDDFGLIEKPLRQFLFEGKHLMHWIEVISVMKQLDAAPDALLSLYHWLKEIKCVQERVFQLILECYHLLRGFNEAIASGPLQVYASALPYLPPESPLNPLYKEQAKLSPKILFGHVKDIRLFSTKLRLDYYCWPNSPIPYLYKLYTKILVNVIDVEDLSPKNRKNVQERLIRVLAMVLWAYEPLSSSDIYELLGPNDNASGIIGHMGTLLNGVSIPKLPVQLLHASFGHFLRDENLNEAFYKNPQRQHAQMAKKCLEVMRRSLKFNIFNLKDVSVPEGYPDQQNVRDEMRRQIHKALEYSCQYWPAHITQMSNDDFGLIEEPLRQFLFVDKHLMHWIEVISVMKQVDAARDALLSLFHWLKEINCIHDWISQLILEGYHLLRCFNKAITSGPLQVYVSALPYLPPESPLNALYKEQATSMLSPKIRIGHIKDIRLFSPKLEFIPHYGYPSVIAFSNNGSRIALLLQTSLEIWDSTTLSLVSDPIALKYPSRDLKSMVFSPDGCKIAILVSGSIEIWDLIERRLLISQNSHGEAILFPDDAHLLYCWMQSNSLEVSEWTISENRIVTYSLQTGSTVACVALSSNAKYLGSISETNEVTVWKLTTHEVISTFNLEGREGNFEVLAISNDEEHIACGSDEGTVELWNFQTGSLVWTGEADGTIKQILMPLTLDNKQLVTVSEHNYVHVWDATSGSRYKHESEASVAALSPDGKHLATSLRDEFRVRTLGASKEAALLPGEELEEVVFLNDGSLIAWGRGVKYGDIVILDNFGSGNVSRHMLEDHTSLIVGLRFSSDGKRLVSWDWDGNIILWGQDGNDIRFSLREKLKFSWRGEAYLMDAVPLPNGGVLVAGSVEKDVVVWNIYGSQNEQKQKQVLRCDGGVCAVKLTSDGRGLVSYDGEYKVFLWCRGSDDVRFELREKHACWGHLECEKCFSQFAYRQSEATTEHLQSSASQTQGDVSKDNTAEELTKGPIFTFDAGSRWVRLVDGRKLWYIPEGFARSKYTLKFTQRGRKIVVYGLRFAILFECKDDFLHILE